MGTQQYNSQGWDLIAAITQKHLNVQLAKIPSVSVNKTESFPLLGMQVPVELNITLHAPQISVKKGSGHLVDINFPISGTITLPSEVMNMPNGQFVTVTTDLAQMDAELQSPDSTSIDYDLVLNLESKDAIANMTLGVGVGDLAFLLEVLLQVIKREIGNGHKYKVASFSLSKAEAASYKAVIPHFADFSFVEDPVNPDRSNLLVLMLSLSTSPGNIFFNAPVLPPDQEAAVLMSNHLFMSQYVLPPLISKIKDMASSPDQVESQISLNLVDKESFLYQIANSSNIPLKKDHDPWIATIQSSIDTNEQALALYLDVKADVTFLNVHVDAWDVSWHKFVVDDKENITLPQTKEDSNQSAGLEWWKWFVAFIISPIIGVVVAIIESVVSHYVPSLGGTFGDVGKNLVTWPNQRTVQLKQIISPNHVVLFVDLEFD